MNAKINTQNKFLFKLFSFILMTPLIAALVFPVNTHADIIHAALEILTGNPIDKALGTKELIVDGLHKLEVEVPPIIDNSANSSAELVADGLTSWLAKQIAKASFGLTGFALDRFGPNLETFFKHTTHPDIWNRLRLMGGAIAVGIFVLSLVMVLLSTIRVTEIKDTPFSLIFRFIISLVVIAFSANCATVLMNIGGNLYAIMVKDVDAVELVNVSKLIYPYDLVVEMMCGIELPFITMVIALVLGVTFLKAILSIYVEVIQRYIIACILAVLFPIAAGTLVSKNTAGIFSKYMQSYLTSILLLCVNGVFVRFVLEVAETFATNSINDVHAGVADAGSLIIGYLFCFAIMKAANRVDEYLYMMGLSVAATGGNLVDSIGQSFRGIINTMSQLTRGAQNATTGAGGAMKQLGIMTGNASLAKAGIGAMALAQPVNSIANGMMPNNASLIKAAAAQGVPASKLNLDSWTPDMTAMVKNGQGAYLNSLDDSMKRKGMEAMFDMSQMPKGTKLSDINFDNKGGVTGTLQFKDQNGHLVSQPFTISPSKMNTNSIPISMPDGKTSYMDTKSALKPGQSIAHVNGNNLSVAELATGMNFDALGFKTNGLANRIATVRAMEGGGFELIDNNGRIIGTVSKDGVPSLTTDGYNYAMGKTYEMKGYVGNIDFDSGMMSNANGHACGAFDDNLNTLQVGDAEYLVNKLDNGSFELTDITGNVVGSIETSGEVYMDKGSVFMDENDQIHVGDQVLGFDGQTDAFLSTNSDDPMLGVTQDKDGFRVIDNDGNTIGRLTEENGGMDIIDNDGRIIGEFAMDGDDISSISVDGVDYANGGMAIREKGDRDNEFCTGQIVGNAYKDSENNLYYTAYGNTLGTSQGFSDVSSSSTNYEPHTISMERLCSYSSDYKSARAIENLADGSVMVEMTTHSGDIHYKRLYNSAGIADQQINSHSYEKVEGHIDGFTVAGISGNEKDSGFKTIIDHCKNQATRMSETVAKVTNTRYVDDAI